MKKIIYILLFATLLFSSTKKVTVQLDWKHQFEYAGFYAAIQNGYYEDIGLHVELKEFNDNKNISDDVINGDATFGVSSSALILDKLQNKPITLLASYFKQNALVLVTSEQISNLKDLKNKKIMATPYELEHTSLGVMLKDAGLNRSDYTLVKHEFNIDKFINGEVDAMSIFITNQTYELNKKKINYNILNPSDYGIYSYDVELFTSVEFAKKNPKLVKEFVKATNKGWKYAFEHKKEIVDLIYNKYSKKKSKEALLYEAKETQKLFKTNVFKIGAVVPELVELNAIIYEKLGFIKKGSNIKSLLSDYIFDVNYYKYTLDLTDKEKKFIAKHPVLKVGNDKFWPPFDFCENGVAKGFNVDYMKEISKLTGIKFEFVQAKNWEDLTAELKNKQIDIMTALDPTDVNKKFATFSEDILVTFETMITKDKNENFNSYKDLYGKNVAIIKGYDLESEIRDNHPQINMILFDNPIEALHALSDEKVDVFIENSSVALYLIKKYFLSNLVLGSSPKFPNLINGDKISIVSRIDYPELSSIIQKALNQISDRFKHDLQSKWMGEINTIQSKSINFTSQEQEYINKNKIIKIANEMDWAPFDYNEFGKATGLSIDYIKLLFSKAGLKYEFVNGHTWSELLKLYNNKKIDVMPAFYKSKKREENTLFTTPYHQGKLYIFSLEDGNIKSIQDLSGNKVGVEQSDASVGLVKEYLKTSNIVEISTTSELINKLRNKKVDAIVCSPLLIKNYIKKNNLLHNFHVVEYIAMNEEETRHISLHVGVRKDFDILYQILQKTINSLDFYELETLKNTWIKDNKDSVLELTHKEHHYLKEKKKITMCIDPDWMPFEKFENSEHVGMTADYFKIFQKSINIPIVVKKTTTWAESLELAKTRECDILSLAMATPSREKYMNFTTPYISVPLVLSTKANVAFISDFNSLSTETLGIPTGYAFAELLKQKYPNLNIIDVKNTKDGLEKVRKGELFGYIGTLASVGHLLQKDYIGELKIAGKFDNNWELGIAVRNDDRVLLKIFDKLVKNITAQKHKEILNKWISINYERGVDYTLLYQSIAVGIIILLIILFWNRKLKLLNKKLSFAKLKAEQATQTKANFLANMSHEIRTPMNSIVSMAYLILESKLNKTQKNYVQTIQKSSQNLIMILNDILDYSKIEVKKLELHKDSFCLLSTLDNISNILKIKADEKELGFKITYNKEITTQFYGDEQRLSQVLTNLLSNAIKFTQEGDVELLVEELGKNKFRFSVIDTGIGLSNEEKDIVFLSFTQVDSTSTRKYSGTGLGLSISKELIELMDGRIWIVSEKGKGSKFIFEVKFDSSDKLTNKQDSVIEDKNISVKTQITPQEMEVLFTKLNEAIGSRRPQLCEPIIQEIQLYELNEEDKKLFNEIRELISRYKFNDAKGLLDER